jgi:Uma2 family endonuclease
MVQSAVLDAATFEPAYGRPMSIEEWEQMDEDEPGELVEGLLQEEEVADSPHEVIVSALLYVFLSWARLHGGRALASETKYALSKRRGRKPDISVFFTRDRKLPRRGAMRHPPDLMVEVVSPDPRDRRRDRIEKLREYAAFGVRWYWLVDPDARSLEILKLGQDGRYVHDFDVTEGAIEVPGCVGLSLDLDALWREVDEEIEHEPPPVEG